MIRHYHHHLSIGKSSSGLFSKANMTYSMCAYKNQPLYTLLVSRREEGRKGGMEKTDSILTLERRRSA